jgi:hypothetical protein
MFLLPHCIKPAKRKQIINSTGTKRMKKLLCLTEQSEIIWKCKTKQNNNPGVWELGREFYIILVR